MSEFKNVTIVKKANIYFDGKVTSRTNPVRRRQQKDPRNYVAGRVHLQHRCSQKLMEVLAGDVEISIGESTEANR